MGAPLLVISALANARTERRTVAAFVVTVLLLALVAFSPLIVVPLTLGGASPAGRPPASGAAPEAHGDWGYPLAGAYRKGRGFGLNPGRGCSYCTSDHKGYDMAQGCGSTIHSAGAGVVRVAGSYFGWGNAVLVDHGNGIQTLYGHMQWGSLRVSIGQHVAVGAPLGAEGNTGHSFGCHLHYEVRRDGVAIDPQPFMAAVGLPLK